MRLVARASEVPMASRQPRFDVHSSFLVGAPRISRPFTIAPSPRSSRPPGGRSSFRAASRSPSAPSGICPGPA
eukprot:1234254-Pyramimonas_sp.AAC.1